MWPKLIPAINWPRLSFLPKPGKEKGKLGPTPGRSTPRLATIRPTILKTVIIIPTVGFQPGVAGTVAWTAASKVKSINFFSPQFRYLIHEAIWTLYSLKTRRFLVHRHTLNSTCPLQAIPKPNNRTNRVELSSLTQVNPEGVSPQALKDFSFRFSVPQSTFNDKYFTWAGARVLREFLLTMSNEVFVPPSSLYWLSGRFKSFIRFKFQKFFHLKLPRLDRSLLGRLSLKLLCWGGRSFSLEEKPQVFPCRLQGTCVC